MAVKFEKKIRGRKSAPPLHFSEMISIIAKIRKMVKMKIKQAPVFYRILVGKWLKYPDWILVLVSMDKLGIYQTLNSTKLAKICHFYHFWRLPTPLQYVNTFHWILYLGKMATLLQEILKKRHKFVRHAIGFRLSD